MGLSRKVREVEYKIANRLSGTNDSRLTDLLISASYMQAACHCMICHGEYLYLHILLSGINVIWKANSWHRPYYKYLLLFAIILLFLWDKNNKQRWAACSPEKRMQCRYNRK
jgi:hypothetical protein